jgi:hypothetical protein
MKTITAREHELITSVIGEGLTALAEAVIEKDLLITEVLRTVVAVDSDGIQLVFCGGTCLSKAHGLIDRMSEDIDFKLVLPEGLSRSARSRLLSQFKKRLAVVLEAAGFAVPAEQIVARDENSYVSLNLHYASSFAPVASLRPEIKVELNARPPFLPTAVLPIASMLDALIQPVLQVFGEQHLCLDLLRGGADEGVVERQLVAHRPDARRVYSTTLVSRKTGRIRGSDLLRSLRAWRRELALPYKSCNHAA